MAGIIINKEKKFIDSFYDSLCNDVQKMHDFYNSESSLIIHYEGDRTEKFQSDFYGQIKRAFDKKLLKVFLSSMVPHKIDNTQLFISVIGQLVFNDKSQKRFSHQFLLNTISDKFLIRLEVFTVLNEEVVYENISDTCVFKVILDNKTVKDIMDSVIEYGELEKIEKDNNLVTCKISSLNVKYNELIEKMKTKGFNIVEK